jgi:queuine/archaeosine tRNA-ribosyltransferase
MGKSLKFFTSLTLTPSDIRKITTHLTDAGYALSDYLDNILVTPLFVAEDSLQRVQMLKLKHDAKVMFDSGGYYIQTGKLAYEELYYPLMKFYLNNQWADVYTLPDHVPTSQDTQSDVWKKVDNTVRYSKLFFDELPPQLQQRAMPVVQGHTFEQIDHCLKFYINMGVKFIGFGSFGTYGQNGEANIATNDSVALARYVVEVAERYGIKAHFFGLGAPALVAMIYGCGAYTFDSSSWIKAAGFGQVFLPFMRAYNISHRNGGSELQKGITVQHFQQLRELTRHQCPFCEDIDGLQQRKMYRTVHNLIVIKETVNIINSGDFDNVRNIYEHGSLRYQKEYEKWLVPA